MNNIEPWYLKNLKEDIIDAVMITGDFTLRSGQKSNYYFDKYKFESNSELLYRICLALRDLLKQYDFDLYAGLEMGGIPIVTILSHHSEPSAIFVRKKAKEYGTKKLAEGVDFVGKKLLIVEDVITSGGQVIESYKELTKQGGHIDYVVCVILRDKKGKENIEKEGLKLISLFDLSE